MSRRVLVTSRSFGQVSDESIRLLEEQGFSIDYMTSNFRLDAFEAAIDQYDALIIGAHPFDPALFARCPKLKIICKHGVGLDNIPVDAAKDNQVSVTYAPGTNSDAVADFTMALILANTRNLFYSVNELKSGNYRPNIGFDAHRKTLGLLGFGAIARRVAKRALGFDMKILAYDPYVSQAPAGLEAVRLCSLEEVLEQSDFVSIHLPFAPATANLVGAAELARMKPSARVINTARGGILDEGALYDAIRDSRLAGAALDVLAQEPIRPDHPLLSLPQVQITNHVASYSREALNAISMICAENIIRCFAGQPLLHQVV